MGGYYDFKMASGKAVQITRQVKPLLSLDNNEAKLRVISLYKAWWRQIPTMLSQMPMPVTQQECQNMLHQQFMKHKDVKDTRIIDMLVVKGQNDLKEVVEMWAMPTHVLSKYWKESHREKPKDFLGKFLAGHD